MVLKGQRGISLWRDQDSIGPRLCRRPAAEGYIRYVALCSIPDEVSVEPWCG